MILVLRPNDFTEDGLEAFKNCGKLYVSHLNYNIRHYFNRSNKVYFSDDKDVKIYEDMRRVK